MSYRVCCGYGRCLHWATHAYIVAEVYGDSTHIWESRGLVCGAHYEEVLRLFLRTGKTTC